MKNDTTRKIPLHRRILYLAVPYLFLLLLIAGIEVATRLALPHVSPLDALIQSPSVQVDLGWEKDSPVFTADPLLFWRVRPNLKEVYWDFTVISTNRQGWRHDGDIGRKPPGGFRVVCVGDSVTFGYRVPLAFPQNPKTYSRVEVPYPLQLERQLREANPDKSIEVISLAVPAYTSYQGLNLLRREINFLKPDIVTACFGWNDVCLRPLPDCVSMPTDWFHVTARWLTCQSQVLVHFAKWRQSKRTIQPNSAPPVARVSVQDYVANLLEIANLSRAHGAEPVLIAPVYHDAHSNPPEAALISEYRNALRAAAQANAVPYLQIEELTETSYPANDKLFGELIHPNIAGHQVMSKELLKFFTAHGMLPGFKLPENL